LRVAMVSVDFFCIFPLYLLSRHIKIDPFGIRKEISVVCCFSVVLFLYYGLIVQFVLGMANDPQLYLVLQLYLFDVMWFVLIFRVIIPEDENIIPNWRNNKFYNPLFPDARTERTRAESNAISSTNSEHLLLTILNDKLGFKYFANYLVNEYSAEVMFCL
jgi:hypothetical protein